MTLLEALDILLKAAFIAFICMAVTLVAAAATMLWNWLFEKRCLCGTVELPGNSPITLCGVRHGRNACWPNRETVVPDQPYDYERWGL